MVQRGTVPENSRVKMAQTFRSGTNDIDAVDFLEMFLEDEEQTSLDTLNDLYVLVNFRPVVTRKNWRMDCGVAGYDNTFGLPPFFPQGCASRTTFTGYGYSKTDCSGSRGCCTASHEEQLYAESTRRGNLQRRGEQSAETQDQIHAHPYGCLTIGFDYEAR